MSDPTRPIDPRDPTSNPVPDRPDAPLPGTVPTPGPDPFAPGPDRVDPEGEPA